MTWYITLQPLLNVLVQIANKVGIFFYFLQIYDILYSGALSKYAIRKHL
jgi:hypothetical protein